MIITADWVLPVSHPPIRDGAVAVRRGRITAVGAAADLAARFPDDEVTRLDGCVLAPGLVNARTRLALSAVGGMSLGADPAVRIRTAAERLGVLDNDDLADSAAYGATRCLLTGTTVVGDVVFGPESPAAAADAGLAGVFFWEVFGISESELVDYLAEREYPADGPTGHGRIRCAAGAHSAYTVGPEALRAVRALTREQGCPFAIRVAESSAESLLFAGGGGPLEPLAAQHAVGFRPPRVSPVDYLDTLGVLERAIAVHCTRADARDARRLAARAQGVVLCPRSNVRLGHGEPPVGDLLHARARLAIGTGSGLDTRDLDLFAEARELMRIAPDLSAERALRIMTYEGAWVLGMADLFGSLEPDKQADLIAVRIPATDDPLETLLREGCRENVRAVMSAGVWRVIDGETAFDAAGLAQAAERVRAKVPGALGGTPG
ncbi:MAG: hypothetical protein FDZ70_02215 [Actinobacteria bacterium]|nr:MAG: hypothetical protein FDZ70_02215 [Actinomycetota bacterium]